LLIGVIRRGKKLYQVWKGTCVKSHSQKEGRIIDEKKEAHGEWERLLPEKEKKKTFVEVRFTPVAEPFRGRREEKRGVLMKGESDYQRKNNFAKKARGW